MSGEARRAHKRIDVNRPVELAELDEYGAVVGYTQDLSEGGVRARFDVTPRASANVLVRLFLEEGANPVEKRGKVVWSAPDIYGDGTEVGLRLLEGEPEDEEADPTPLLPELSLCVGQPVRVSRGGVAYDAVVAEIGEPDDEGRIPVVLNTAAEVTVDEPLTDDDRPAADEALDAEQWKPHPLRDVWEALRRYGGPPVRALARVAVACAAACSRFFAWAWRKVPAQPRTSAEWLLGRVRRGLGRFRDSLARRLASITSRRTAPVEEE